MELGAFEEQERSGHNESIMSQTGMAAPAGKKAGLMVSPASANNGSRDRNIAHIKLKLQASEKSDGLARLLNDVVKEQGPTGLVQE
jgi:hypothetical protein